MTSGLVAGVPVNMSKDIGKALDDLKRELRADLRTLKDSVKSCSDTCDGVNEIKNEIKELRKEVQKLSSRNEELATENRRLNEKVEELEQYQRSNNLEIKGVPEAGDAYDVVKRIGTLLDEPILDSDIDVCHRIPTFRATEKNIIVRFVQRTKRDKILQKSKKKRLTSTDLDYGGHSSPVYVNEHLTSSNKRILGAAIAKKKDVGWKFVWSSGGKILARKDENADIIRIASLSDVDKIRN